MELYRPTILSGTLVPLTTALDLSHNDHDSKILPSIAFWQLHTKGNTVYNLIYIPAKLIYYLPALSQSLLQFNFARIRTSSRLLFDYLAMSHDLLETPSYMSYGEVYSTSEPGKNIINKQKRVYRTGYLPLPHRKW